MVWDIKCSLRNAIRKCHQMLLACQMKVDYNNDAAWQAVGSRQSCMQADKSHDVISAADVNAPANAIAAYTNILFSFFFIYTYIEKIKLYGMPNATIECHTSTFYTYVRILGIIIKRI